MTTFRTTPYTYKIDKFFCKRCSLRCAVKMLRVIVLVAVISGAWGQFWTKSSTILIPTDNTAVLTPALLKIIKDRMIIDEKNQPIDMLPIGIGREETCSILGLCQQDRKVDVKDEMKRKEEAVLEMFMRDTMCRKMGIDCRGSEMCEKMGVMCTKEEMCKKMGMDCSKKDMCELMGVDCKRENMCDKMGVMCTMEDMCKKKGIGCSDVLLKQYTPVKANAMWVQDEFSRPILMDVNGRRISGIQF